MTSFSTSESSSCFIYSVATKKWITTFFGWKRKFGEIYLFQFIVLLSLSLSLSLSLFPCLRIGQRCTHTNTHTWAPLTRFFSSSHTHTHTHTQTSFSHHTSFSSLLLSVTLTWSQKCFHLLSLSHTHTQHTQIQALSLKHALTHTFFYLLCCGLRQRRLNRSDNNLVQIKK